MSKNKEYIITSIVYKKNEIILKYAFLEEEKELSIHPNVFSNFYLYIGKVLTSEELTNIKQDNKLAKDIDYAYSLISRKEYSCYLLKRKLLDKGISSKIVYDIIETLKGQHLLDDKRYAEDLIESLEIRLYGVNYIQKSLKDAGINDDIIYSFSFVSEEDKIQKLIPTLLKKRSKDSFMMLKKHLYEDLIKKGYEIELINFYINKLESPDEDEEANKCKRDYQKYYRLYSGKYQKKELYTRIITSLMRKGHSYDIIKKVMEVDNDE